MWGDKFARGEISKGDFFELIGEEKHDPKEKLIGDIMRTVRGNMIRPDGTIGLSKKIKNL